ncbi:MAG: nuclear transport factor 2 family protein, partial [Actinobacteria bacterium]|nr:nuclear transport factor 2 family protein [Actinomycetota bacterium]
MKEPAMTLIDPQRTWHKVELRLATETEPILRRNLEVLLEHAQAEAARDLPRLMATVAEDAVYQTFSQDPATWPRG